MNRSALRKIAFAVCILAAGILPAHAQLVITEVDAAGSSSIYGADWFELTNLGGAAVTINSSWKMDDSSALFASAVAFRGSTVINPGQSAIFLEGNATGTTDATILANFNQAWFGAPTSALAIGFYGGSGVGLSTAGDGVNVFNPGGTNVAGVSFGVAGTGVTFDNAAGLNGAISQLSTVGVNGAFTSFNGTEVGSPGLIAAVPEPETYAMMLAGLGFLGFQGRRRKPNNT